MPNALIIFVQRLSNGATGSTKSANVILSLAMTSSPRMNAHITTVQMVTVVSGTMPMQNVDVLIAGTSMILNSARLPSAVKLVCHVCTRMQDVIVTAEVSPPRRNAFTISVHTMADSAPGIQMSTLANVNLVSTRLSINILVSLMGLSTRHGFCFV